MSGTSRSSFRSWSQDEAQAATRPQDLELKDRASLAELEAVAVGRQHMLVATDERVDVPVTDLVDEERRFDRERRVGRLADAHVRHQPPGARVRVLRVRMLALEPADARCQQLVVVPNVVLRAVRIRVRPIRGGYLVRRTGLEQREPFVQPPLVEQRGLLEEKVLDLLACDRSRHADVPLTSVSQCRQKPRIPASSTFRAGSPRDSRSMPREMSLQSTSGRGSPAVATTPRWTHSYASTSSGVASPPGPMKLPRILMRSARASALSPEGASSHARPPVKPGAAGSSWRAASPSMSKSRRFGKT